MKNYVKIAHRSNTTNPYLENTVEAFRNAVANENVEGMEIDIQLTKDGVFVLMNYEDIKNVLPDSQGGLIKDYTYEELSNMTLTANPAVVKQIIDTYANDFQSYSAKMLQYCSQILRTEGKIATLKDILAVNRIGKSLTIEIKDIDIVTKEDAREYVKRLMGVCFAQNMQNVIFISRSVLVLEALKMYNPYFTCLPVIGYNDIEKLSYGFDGASIANNHLEKVVPGTDLEAHEFLKDNSSLVTQIWNINNPLKAKEVSDIMQDHRYMITGDTPDLMDSFMDDASSPILEETGSSRGM